MGEERRTIHWAVEQHRRRHAGQSQAGGEGCCLPVAVGNGGPASLAAWRPAAQAGHLCRGWQRWNIAGYQSTACCGIQAFKGVREDK
ncbi:hypothetical protein FHS85_001506 [Rhodoligotrophos appendicifer]